MPTAWRELLGNEQVLVRKYEYAYNAYSAYGEQQYWGKRPLGLSLPRPVQAVKLVAPAEAMTTMTMTTTMSTTTTTTKKKKKKKKKKKEKKKKKKEEEEVGRKAQKNRQLVE